MKPISIAFCWITVVVLGVANVVIFSLNQRGWFDKPVQASVESYSHERDCPPGRQWPHSPAHPYLPRRGNEASPNETIEKPVYGMRGVNHGEGGLVEWWIGRCYKRIGTNDYTWERVANFYQDEQAAREYCVWKNGPAPEHAASDLQASLTKGNR